jgi:hypothetical protein
MLTTRLLLFMSHLQWLDLLAGSESSSNVKQSISRARVECRRGFLRKGSIGQSLSMEEIYWIVVLLARAVSRLIRNANFCPPKSLKYKESIIKIEGFHSTQRDPETQLSGYRPLLVAEIMSRS